MSTVLATTIDPTRPGVPQSRLVKVELRKMFDTRSGFWLMMSVAIISLLATIAVILFANDRDMNYGTFSAVIGFPLAVILPIIAILSVTGEWSQRTGLITFTLIPHRGQLIWAKAISSIIVGVASVVLAFAIGAVGNVVGSTIAGVSTSWDLGGGNFFLIMLGNVLGLLVGFMLGLLIRNSAGAIVAYFVYSFVLPTIFGILAATQDWFKDLQPWVDFNFSQSKLYDVMQGSDWTHLGVSGLIWLALPLAIGAWTVLRAEVK